ncbi:hypothetical protein NDU88_005765 [Pleurodeles waltl]|uniref:Uncharacterized protein n=1 Tax=Pleurodeles waltl TaxID=8319 RepID=A0AAV7SMK8_PLEWA|nr:hypothetical protein NDU88_005765 [Pleurodeles waltl]
MAAPPRLRPETRLRGGGVETWSCVRPNLAEEGSLPVGSGTRKSALGCLNADGGRAAPYGQEPEMAVPPRLGPETRLRGSEVPVLHLPDPAEEGSRPAGSGMRKSALSRLNADGGQAAPYG